MFGFPSLRIALQSMITWCGKMSKQVIEPYAFQCKTNIEEHNDMVNKINEIVDVVNELDVEEITKDITALESEVSAQGNEIDALNADVAELPTKAEVANTDVTAVAVDKTSAGIEIQLTRPAGVLEDSVSLPFINTATLIPTSTDRAFKIRFTYTDGTQYDTNEFVIPEGGGTDVSVTGVTVEDGTAPNSFKVAIQLSDASTIASNDYEIEIPAQQNTYPTSVAGTLSGTTLNLTIGLNNSTNVTGTADLSAFLTKSEASTTYATKTEVTAVDTKVDAIGVTSEGNNVTVNGSNATIVKSVSGQVTDGNLKITVNGVESGDIPLPDAIGKVVYHQGTNSGSHWGFPLNNGTFNKGNQENGITVANFSGDSITIVFKSLVKSLNGPAFHSTNTLNTSFTQPWMTEKTTNGNRITNFNPSLANVTNVKTTLASGTYEADISTIRNSTYELPRVKDSFGTGRNKIRFTVEDMYVTSAELINIDGNDFIWTGGDTNAQYVYVDSDQVIQIT